MPLKQPRTKTVKRLFAVSRNQCAFEECDAPLVDLSGIVTGEICHIQSRNSDGPRFNAAQSDEDRHGFDNLILLCPTHHKIVDEMPVVKFTVDRLQQLKAQHQAGTSDTEPSDEIAEKLLINSGFIGDLKQESGDGGVNILATGGSVVISSSLTYSEVKEIANDVYRSNALELSGVARKVAQERVDAMINEFLESLKAAAPEPPDSLADPDMQHVLFAAQRHAARTESKDFSSILVDLLVRRATETKKDLLQVVLGEAVETAGRLTMEQLDALTLVFIFRNTRRNNLRSIEQLGSYCDQFISTFLATAARSRASFQHLQYAGCGALEMGSAALYTIIQKTYGYCAVSRLDQKQFEEVVQLSGDVTQRLLNTGCFKAISEDELEFFPLSDNESETLFRHVGADDASHQRFVNLITQNSEKVQMIERLRSVCPRFTELEDWWKEHPAHFVLTSVGIALAHANLRRCGIDTFDLRIWIN